MLVEVTFKGNRKEFFLWDAEEAPPANAAVVVEADRGEDLGVIRAAGDAAEQRARGVPHGPGEEPVMQRVRRLASREDLRRNEELRAQDEDARRKAMERVRSAGLAMKVSDAEWRWDRRKLTFYFTSERRVDFRALVRELAALFRARIELKQIGVRDEARRLSGIGRCGREYCSASWLPELRPVNLGVARDQRLSLNPTQISGACGRLMCCLRYEHEFYVQQRRRFPKEGKVIETSKGEEKVMANDIFRERVTLRGSDGETRIVALSELRREWRNRPPTLELAVGDEEGPALLDTLPDEVLRLQDTSEMPAWVPRAGSSRGLPVVEPGSAGRQTTKSSRPAAADLEPPDDAGPDVDENEGDDGIEEDSPADGPQPTADAAGGPRRPRRRRGRRGGRRGRRRDDGGGGQGNDPGPTDGEGDRGGSPPPGGPPIPPAGGPGQGRPG